MEGGERVGGGGAAGVETTIYMAQFFLQFSFLFLCLPIVEDFFPLLNKLENEDDYPEHQ